MLTVRQEAFHILCMYLIQMTTPWDRILAVEMTQDIVISSILSSIRFQMMLQIWVRCIEITFLADSLHLN